MRFARVFKSPPKLEEKVLELKGMLPELPSTDIDASQEMTNFFGDRKACNAMFSGLSGRKSKALLGLSGMKHHMKSEEEPDAKLIKSEFSL